MKTSDAPQNVVVLHVAAVSGAAPTDLERRVTAASSGFSIASRPYLASALFSHRLLRGAAGAYLWEITLEGLDLPGDDQAANDSLGDAIVEEARGRLDGIGEITSFGAYADLLLPPAPIFAWEASDSDRATSFGDEDELQWEDYARDSGKDEAGAELPADLIDAIAAERDAAPAEPGLTPWRSGHMYTGANDKAHLAYLKGYFEDRAKRANPTDRRKIQAFRTFQAREGSTAAINTYDNQIVTWGTGWGGLGWMGKVVERASASPKVRDLFTRSGLRYRGKNVYDVVDLEAGRCVTGSRDALLVIQRSIPLLNVLIHAARAPETRDAVTEAQLVTFMQSAADYPGADALGTQALFNLIAHLKHWAPGYVVAPGKWLSCLEWALPQVGGDKPSAERDQRLAPLVGRYFYGMPRTLKMGWIPDWKQMQIYWRHMKDDGLDCLGDAFIKASSPPADDPFATVSAAQPAPAIAAKGPAAPPAPTIAAKGPAAPPPRAALKETPKADPRPTLTSAPLAGEAELERIARGEGALRKGSKGAAVKAMQEALIALSFDISGGADGLFGPGLERTVKAFQAARGLTADGVVGPGTLKAMDAALGAVRAAT